MIDKTDEQSVFLYFKKGTKPHQPSMDLRENMDFNDSCIGKRNFAHY